jgi:hypothetical protein
LTFRKPTSDNQAGGVNHADSISVSPLQEDPPCPRQRRRPKDLLSGLQKAYRDSCGQTARTIAFARQAMKPGTRYNLFMLVFLWAWLSLVGSLQIWPHYVVTGLSRREWLWSTLWIVLAEMQAEMQLVISRAQFTWRFAIFLCESCGAALAVFAIVWLLGYFTGHCCYRRLPAAPAWFVKTLQRFHQRVTSDWIT